MLHIGLRDGFQNDTVTIAVDRKEVYRKSGVTTDLTISAADSIDVPVESATVLLQVSVERGPRRSQEISIAKTPFVDVHLIRGNLEFIASEEQIPML